MNERSVSALRILVIAVAGYFSLATSSTPDWYVRSAHVDVPIEAVPTSARIRVTLEAEAVIILAPDAVGIQSSSGQSWTPEDGPHESEGYCSGYHRDGIFCEEVPGGSGSFDYELFMAAGVDGSSARIEVLAGGPPERLEQNFGVNIEVLP